MFIFLGFICLQAFLKRLFGFDEIVELKMEVGQAIINGFWGNGCCRQSFSINFRQLKHDAMPDGLNSVFGAVGCQHIYLLQIFTHRYQALVLGFSQELLLYFDSLCVVSCLLQF